MTLWHLEPIFDEIQSLSKDMHYFAKLDEISQSNLGLTLGDLETLSITRLSLFLISGQDIGKGLIAYSVLEKLLEFEDNLFCAAMYRRKLKDLVLVLSEVADRQGVSLQGYVA